MAPNVLHLASMLSVLSIAGVCNGADGSNPWCPTEMGEYLLLYGNTPTTYNVTMIGAHCQVGHSRSGKSLKLEFVELIVHRVIVVSREAREKQPASQHKTYTSWTTTT